MSDPKPTISAQDPAERDAESDSEVILSLLCERWSYPCTVEEIARELQDPVNATDSVQRLIRAGLLHRSGSFVWPTRAALHAAKLDIGAA